MPARRSPTPGSGSRPERGSNPRRASSQSDLMEQLRVFNTSSKVSLLLPSLLGPEIDTLGLSYLGGPSWKDPQVPGVQVWLQSRAGEASEVAGEARV